MGQSIVVFVENLVNISSTHDVCQNDLLTGDNYNGSVADLCSEQGDDRSGVQKL